MYFQNRNLVGREKAADAAVRFSYRKIFGFNWNSPKIISSRWNFCKVSTKLISKTPLEKNKKNGCQ